MGSGWQIQVKERRWTAEWSRSPFKDGLEWSWSLELRDLRLVVEVVILFRRSPFDRANIPLKGDAPPLARSVE